MSSSAFASGWTASDLHGSDGEEDLEEESDISRDALLFAIDASETMLKPPASRSMTPDGPPDAKRRRRDHASGMLETLRAILKLMKAKIVRNPKDMVGIVIFNTRETKGIGGEAFQNIYVLQDLLELDAPMVQTLKNLIRDAEDDASLLLEMFEPQSGPSVIGSAISTCNQLLRSRAHHISSKRIYLVTAVADPFPLNADRERHHGFRIQAQTVARDCAEMNYTIRPFFVADGDAPFDVTSFYKDFLIHHVELDDDEAPKFTIRTTETSEHGWDHFLSTTAVRPPPKRSAFSIPFIIGDLEISINGYNIISEARKSAAVKVDLQGAEPREIAPQTKYIDTDAGDVLDPKQHIKTYFSVGAKDEGPRTEKKIVFEDDEKEILRSVGLRLLGFLAYDSIPVEHFSRHAIFIYPSESFYIGSTRLFVSLLNTMIEKDVVGLGLLLARKSSTPQHVLIVPQVEKRTEEDEQLEPPGLQLIQLPYADDIRPCPEVIAKNGTLPASRETDPDASRPDLDLAKKIIGKLRFKNGYQPESYDNPALHHHYACLEALALQEEKPVPKDDTLPKYVNIHKRAGELIHSLIKTIDENPECHLTVAKRAKTTEGKPITSKQPRKIEGTAPAPQEDYVLDLFKRKQSGKLKRDEMVYYLESVDAPFKKSANKSALGTAIEEYLKDKGRL